MLRAVRDLQGYAINATDGVIGVAADFLFDDDDWTVRYLVVDTGSWLHERQVLVSPIAVGAPDWVGTRLPVSLTRAQVEHSPAIETVQPVSRDHEAEYLRYYGYPSYWGGDGLWGMSAFPGGVTSDDAVIENLRATGSPDMTPSGADSHLHSIATLTGVRVHASDGEIGHVENMLLDDQTWALRYLVIDTSNWWGGQHVLVPPQWIHGVNWTDRTLAVSMTREAVKAAPPYTPESPLDREQERAIYRHYDHPGYWTAKAPRDLAQRRH